MDFKNCKYVDSFTIPILLNNIDVSAATYNNSDDVGNNGLPDYLKNYGKATYASTNKPYNFTFRIPGTLKSNNVKYIKVKDIVLAEPTVSTYQGLILIRSDICNNSDKILATLPLSGVTDAVASKIASFSSDRIIDANIYPNNTYNLEFLGTSVTATNLDLVSISLVIECYE